MTDVPALRQHATTATAAVWTFSKPGRASLWPVSLVAPTGCPTLPRRITVSRDGSGTRIECLTERQSFTSWWKGAPEELFDLLWQCHYGNTLVQTQQADWQTLRSARDANRVTIRRLTPSRTEWTNVTADAEARHTMTADDRQRLHEAFGMLTSDGQLRGAMADKARQVDRLVDRAFALDVIRSAHTGSVIHITDAGCGKAYLSIALALALQQRGVVVHLRGIDANEHVVEQAMRAANYAGIEHASFECSTIAHATPIPTDVFIALHACDTASDDAIRLALTCGAQAMLVAPCCHHAIQRQLREHTVPEAVRPLLRDGIQRERLGDLLTDAIRREFIRGHGYAVGLEEFISLEHTGKNVLICAEQRRDAQIPSLEELRAFTSLWGVSSTLLEPHP